MASKAVHSKIPKATLLPWCDKFRVCSGKQARARDKSSVSGHHTMLRSSSGLKWSDKYHHTAVMTPDTILTSSPPSAFLVFAKLKRERVCCHQTVPWEYLDIVYIVLIKP